MEEKLDKKSPVKIRKVLRPGMDENYWDCSVCTYRNGAEAFKCAMCDVRKGTSTRKPKLNSQLVAQQVAQQFVTSPPPLKKIMTKKPFKKSRPKLKNVDRSSAQHMAVTVGNITVIITDYKLLKPENSPSMTPERNSPAPTSEDNADPGPSLGTEHSNGVSNQEGISLPNWTPRTTGRPSSVFETLRIRDDYQFSPNNIKTSSRINVENK